MLISSGVKFSYSAGTLVKSYCNYKKVLLLCDGLVTCVECIACLSPMRTGVRHKQTTATPVGIKQVKRWINEVVMGVCSLLTPHVSFFLLKSNLFRTCTAVISGVPHSSLSALTFQLASYLKYKSSTKWTTFDPLRSHYSRVVYEHHVSHYLIHSQGRY